MVKPKQIAKLQRNRKNWEEELWKRGEDETIPPTKLKRKQTKELRQIDFLRIGGGAE